MKKDQILINKFLELLPDDFLDWIFSQLEQNMISVDRIAPMKKYINYIEKYNLLFNDKNLKKPHSNFFISFKILVQFIDKNFFLSNSATEFLVLYPEIKYNDPETYRDFNNELDKLLDNTKKHYLLFRKMAEKVIFSETKIKNNNIWLDEKGISCGRGVIFPFKIIKGSRCLPRTKMLIFLSKQKNNVPTKKLLEKSGFSRDSALKRCIEELNTIFVSNLGKELICHDKTNGTFGINRDSFNFAYRSKQ